MSAKDGILHAMKWTVKDEFNHKMEVSNAVDGCVIFYPHNDMVQITYEDLDKLIANLRKPNSDYILKKPQVEEIRHYTEINPKDFVNEARNIAAEYDPYVQEELGKRLAVAEKSEKPEGRDAHEMEIARREFADNYYGKYIEENGNVYIRVPMSQFDYGMNSLDEVLLQWNLGFRYIQTDIRTDEYVIAFA